MKSVLLVALFGVLFTFSYAAKASLASEDSRTETARHKEGGGGGGHGGGGQGGGGHGGGGQSGGGGGEGGQGWGKPSGGGGGGGGWGKEESGGGGGGMGGSHVYHETQGNELFQGDEKMLLIPLILIPLIVLACWYLMGGKGGGGGEEGWGWDRMGYSDSNSVGGYQSGSYDTRSLAPADSLDKATHQRIMNSIQQQPQTKK